VKEKTPISIKRSGIFATGLRKFMLNFAAEY